MLDEEYDEEKAALLMEDGATEELAKLLASNCGKHNAVWNAVEVIFASGSGQHFQRVMGAQDMLSLYDQLLKFGVNDNWDRPQLDFLAVRLARSVCFLKRSLQSIPVADGFLCVAAIADLVCHFLYPGMLSVGFMLETITISDLRDEPSQMDNMFDEVAHGELPAVISEREAQAIEDEAHASWIEHNIGASSSFVPEDVNYEDSAFEKLYLLRFTRHPSEFEERLYTGPELEMVRTSMDSGGCSPRLSSGATLLVYPEQYPTAMRVLANTHLRHYHVCVSETFFPLVLEAVDSLASRLKVRLRSSDVLAYIGSDNPEDVFIVEHTFLSSTPQMLHNAHSVTQSTSVAHGVTNPRRRMTG